ncbi:MAG: hypothetical protein E7054_01710 [Lentisphaerae bacterium]|nr:hypothetical protein [Lentisphaerota bacterium]
MKRLIPVLLLAISALTLPGKEIVFTENFDQQPAGWTASGHFKWDSTGGKDKKGAFTASRENGKELLQAVKRVKLEHGVRYLVKVDFNSKLLPFNGKKYQIPLEIRFLKNGKAVAKQDLVRSDPGDGKKWRFSSFSFVVPANYDAEVEVALRMYSTRTGQIWYDNLVIEALERFGAQLLCAPFLSHFDTGKVTVNFLADTATPAAVDYRIKGSSKWERCNELLGGQQRNDRKEHFITLENLQPGKVYEYRAVLIPVPHLDSEIYSDIKEFTAVPDKFVPFSAFYTSDTQVGIRNRSALFRDFAKNAKADTADLFIHGGDIANGFAVSSPDVLIGSYINVLAEKPKKSRYFVSVRGNHEYRGNASGDFFKYLSGGTEKSYFTFNYGKVCFIVLDTGETEPRMPRSPDYCRNFTGKMMLEQREFLQNVVKSKAFQEAKYRVVLAHAPYYAGKYYAHMAENIRTIAKGILFGTDTPAKIHLYLAGHTHSYSRSVALNSLEQMKFADGTWNAYAEVLPFALCVNDGPGKANGGPEFSGIKLDFADNGITVTGVYPDGREFDKFLILPDGSIKEFSTTLVKKQGN